MKYKFVALLMSILFLLAACGEAVPEVETAAPSIPETTVPVTTMQAPYVYGSSIDASQLHFYEFTEPCSFVHSSVWLDGEDFVPMNMEEVLEFYGLSGDVTEVLSHAQVGVAWNSYGVYYNEESGYYHTENVFTYEFSEGGQIFLLLTMDDPMDIFAPEVYEDPEYSDVNGCNLLLGRYDGEEHDIYAQLALGDTNILVRFRNIPEQDTLAVLDYLTLVNK